LQSFLVIYNRLQPKGSRNDRTDHPDALPE
jgi:hypothetical protein